MKPIFRNWNLPFRKKRLPDTENVNVENMDTSNLNHRQWSDEEVLLLTERLAQVICWTDHLASIAPPDISPSLIFRQTNPVIYDVPMYDFRQWGIEEPDWSDDIFYKYAIDYHEILKLAVKERPVSTASSLPGLAAKGKILTFETGVTTVCGGPVLYSRGFVDRYDIPPVDTWFYVKKNYRHAPGQECSLALFCWIPKAYQALMQSAIDVEILDSYRWLDENDPELYQKLNS